MNILIKNGRVVDPENKIDEALDVLIRNGKIEKVGKGLKANGAEVIDAKGKIVAPGFIDMHVHLRQPGREYAEDFHTGSRAAARGGFSTLLAMPNTTPPADNQGVIEYVINESRKKALVNIFPAGCITKQHKGEELTEIGELVRSGALAITDDGAPVSSSIVLRRALEYSSTFDIPVIDHCEDKSLSNNGVMNEGLVSTKLGLKGIPNQAESIIVERDAELAALTNGRVHIAHVSTRESVEVIRAAKRKGTKITCETMPHYFALTDEAVKGYNTNAKMNPPLRTKADVEAIKEGLADGTIDAIATDHAPHADCEKDLEFDKAAFGIIGLEAAFSLSIMELVDKKALSIAQLVEKLSFAPAKILGLAKKGSLSKGNDADVVIFDPNSKWIYDKSYSKSKNSPFLGEKLKGRVCGLIVGGKVVLRGDEFVE